jgi:hypothetical protein
MAVMGLHGHFPFGQLGGLGLFGPPSLLDLLVELQQHMDDVLSLQLRAPN